ncbi:MAG: CHASE domain-containing protein [Verrucomicrobia bacterium]|nr:CHASE domain-containing protein [Verrucomicrobiota bacterium]
MSARPPDSGRGRSSVESSFRAHLPAWIAGLGGIVLTALLFANQRQQQEQRIRTEFDRRVENHMRALQNRINSHGELLLALRNLFRYSTDVSREQFGEVARDLINRNPGIQALKWVPRVPASERPAYEAAGRSDSLTNYQFTEFGLNRQLIAAQPRREHYPLHYIEPIQENRRLIGWDVASDPMRLGWLMESCDTMEVSVSERITLSKETNPQASVTVIAAVFRGETKLETVQERRENLQGFVLGMFRVGDGVEFSLLGNPFGGLDVLVVDNSSAGTNRFLYYHPGETNRPQVNLAAAVQPGPSTALLQTNLAPTVAPTETEIRSGMHRIEKVAMSHHREWLCLFRPTSEFLASLKSQQPMFALVAGFSFSALLTAYLLAAGRRSQQVEAVVKERTAALEKANTRLEREMRERGQMALALLESEQHLRTLIEVCPDAILVSRNSQVVFVNEAALHLFGADSRDQLLRKSPYDLVHPDYHDAVTERRWQVVELGVPAPVMEQKIIRLDGRTVDVEVAATPFKDREGSAIVGLFRDITERKLAEQERQRLNRKLQEAAKLESLGVMAGGVAHDFNNLLTGILCHASLAKLDLPADSPLQEGLTEIETASLRAAELCKQMLAYSGKGQLLVQALDLSAVVQDSLNLLRLSISKKVSLELSLASGLPPVEADATQIRQVIMNLVINASEAIGENTGAIRVSTSVMRASREYLAGTILSPEIPEGDYVFLEVVDTGCGMSAETISKIFDPFFTTKFTGRGLGLAAVLGIVRGHSGALQVTSQLGRGSAFRLLLPVAAATALNRAPSEAEIHLCEWRGSGTVLVVDDEEPVRRVAAQSLRRLGFDPVLAKDGREALQIFQRDPDHFVAVLLDLTMPQLDGSQTFQALKLIRPGVRVVLMSGFDQQEAITRFAGKGLAGFLQKPFQVHTLRERMQAALVSDP